MLGQAVITPSAAHLDRKHAFDTMRRPAPGDPLIGAAEAGLRQVVFVAPELDPRPYVLPWPAGTTVFVLDSPSVLEFTRTTLAAAGTASTATVRAVPVGTLRRWSARRLMLAGFDATKPTLWIVEGLLPFLSRDDKDELLQDITALSRSRSQLVSHSPSYPFQDSGTLDVLKTHGWQPTRAGTGR
jgi:methyltransferase (TIGR00027 family)